MIAAIALAAAVQVIQIQATEYRLALPARIPAGLTTFAFENKGTEPHDVRFLRIDTGHTFDEFVEWSKRRDPIPKWLETAGGIGTVAPGRSEQYTATLAAGSYVALCTYPTADGDQHFRKGMHAPLTVGPERSTDTAPPEDVTLRLHDHGFQLTAPISGGRTTIRVHNAGTEAHQALVIRLPDGASEWNERGWFTNGSRGPRPGEPIGGVIELAPEGDAWFSVDIAPGRYIILCTILEEEGRHFDLGMVYRFTVE